MSEFSIAPITSDQIPQFLEFYKQAFVRKYDIEERFANQIVNNPFRRDFLPVPVAIDGGGKIIGQFPLMPARYRYEGASYPCVFGYDYYVDSNYRGSGVGTELAKSAFADFGVYFTAGVTQRAGRIHERLGLKLVGSTRGWLRLSRPTALIRLAAEKAGFIKQSVEPASNLTQRCPDNIIVRSGEFRKTTEIHDWKHNCVSPKIIEFDRSPKFLHWRYGFFTERYVLYEAQVTHQQCYFAATAIRKNGLLVLSIIDYRSTGEPETCFRAIIHAALHLRRVLGCDGLFVASSHRMFDKILRRRGFFRPGQPGLLYTNAPHVTTHATLGERDRIFLTLADGDGDLNSHYGT